MSRFIIRRLLFGVVTLWIISVVSFALIQLPPGDYVESYVAQQLQMGTDVSQADAERLRQRYGLDEPFPVQYVRWMSRVVRGDFGMSMEWRRPVSDLIGERLLLTVVLSVATVAFTWALALPIGIYSAVRQYSIGDYIFTFVGFVGVAIPNFLLALILMYVGYAFFNTNVGGLFSPEYADAPWSAGRIWDLAKHLPIPALILALSSTAQVIRVLRANLLDELRKPYVVNARAKGLREFHVIVRHPVRVALAPLISTIGYLFPFIISGSIIISLVLGLPTVGPLLFRALLAQDMFLAGTIILMLGAMTVIGTLISDILLMWIDPRVREG